jgi:hypothetical protein
MSGMNLKRIIMRKNCLNTMTERANVKISIKWDNKIFSPYKFEEDVTPNLVELIG